jgi:hypothetical protein
MVGGWHRIAIAYNTRRAPEGGITLAEVQQAIDMCGPRGARAVQIGDRSRFVINQRTVQKQAVGRIFLAGDAAHVHSVVGAQGLNIGVQDSFNLAWKLAAVITGNATRELLETYAAERHPAAARIVRGTRRATRMTLLRHAPMVWARRHIAPLVLGRPKARNTIEHALSQLDISYRRPGATTVGAQPVMTGDRASDATLRHFSAAARRTTPVTRLFDVVGRDEFSLILVVGATELGVRYKQIRRITAEFPMVREYVVLPDAVAVDDAIPRDVEAAVLVDVGDALRRKYHIVDEAMLLIRPDGYLALRHDNWAPGELERRLRRWLVATESDLLEER